MLPKLCHLDNDLEIIIMIQYIYCVVHMTFTYLPWYKLGLQGIPGDTFFVTVHTPVWPWPVYRASNFSFLWMA